MNPPSFSIATKHSAQNLSLFILIIKYYRRTDHTVKDTHSCTHHMVTSIHTLHNNFMLQMRYLLLNLVTAVSRRQINNQSQFPCRMTNILPFELSFFRFIGPCKTFIEIYATIYGPCYENQPPTNRLEHLYRATAQSFLQPYTEFLSCEHHPDTLIRPIIITFK
jgi:hypothetical protein